MMRKCAKVFMNGRSQAVRLPAWCRFDSKEVFIRKDDKTGDVILSKKPANWQGFFDLYVQEDIPKDFMTHREDFVVQDKELF